MIPKSFINFTIVILIVFFASQSFAGLIDWDVRNRYLKEQEAQAKGTPDAAKAAPRLPLWMQEEPVVQTDDEKKFDANKDGRFQPSETKVYLRRAAQQIESGATVNLGGKDVKDSSVLKEYDANKDGLISRIETDQMKKDAF